MNCLSRLNSIWFLFVFVLVLQNKILFAVNLKTTGENISFFCYHSKLYFICADCRFISSVIAFTQLHWATMIFFSMCSNEAINQITSICTTFIYIALYILKYPFCLWWWSFHFNYNISCVCVCVCCFRIFETNDRGCYDRRNWSLLGK